MGYHWASCPYEIKDLVYHLAGAIKDILNDHYAGFYIHGSLAMGGFNPKSSDIDVLVITKTSIDLEDKRTLARFFLTYSNAPYPIEISFLSINQLIHWHHPSPFEFHYSEFWRKRYSDDLLNDTYLFLNNDSHTDSDLAAHITVLNHRGICVEGSSIKAVFPVVPRSDYLSSILGDYQDCLEHIEEDPIYCSLNLIRVFWYLKEGVISSKQEAGNWGMKSLPHEIGITINKVVKCYSGTREICSFDKNELISLRNYISNMVQELLEEQDWINQYK